MNAPLIVGIIAIIMYIYRDSLIRYVKYILDIDTEIPESNYNLTNKGNDLDIVTLNFTNLSIKNSDGLVNLYKTFQFTDFICATDVGRDANTVPNTYTGKLHALPYNMNNNILSNWYLYYPVEDRNGIAVSSDINSGLSVSPDSMVSLNENNKNDPVMILLGNFPLMPENSFALVVMSGHWGAAEWNDGLNKNEIVRILSSLAPFRWHDDRFRLFISGNINLSETVIRSLLESEEVKSVYPWPLQCPTAGHGAVTSLQNTTPMHVITDMDVVSCRVVASAQWHPNVRHHPVYTKVRLPYPRYQSRPKTDLLPVRPTIELLPSKPDTVQE